MANLNLSRVKEQLLNDGYALVSQKDLDSFMESTRFYLHEQSEVPEEFKNVLDNPDEFSKVYLSKVFSCNVIITKESETIYNISR